MSGLAYRRVWVFMFVLVCSVLVGDANGKRVRVKVAEESCKIWSSLLGSLYLVKVFPLFYRFLFVSVAVCSVVHLSYFFIVILLF